RVGEIPDALRQLRVLLFPLFVRAAAGRAAQRLGLVVPRAAPNRPRIQLRRNWAEGGAYLAHKPAVIVGNILGQRPIRHIPVHVVQTPRVGLLLAHLVVLVLAVVKVPGVLVELACVVAERIGRPGARAASIFPFGLGWQAVIAPGLSRKPLAIALGRVL